MCWNAMNVRIVLASLATDAGGKEAATFLGFLDLPHSVSFGCYGLKKVEANLSNVLEKVTEEAMGDSLKKEKCRLKQQERN
eukprot:10630202-Ditylum_brightwellii.AAC.1